jgi:hypothetical protein
VRSKFAKRYKKLDLAYFAGIVDGEGCIYCYEKRVDGKYITRSAGIQVANTSEALIQWLMKFHKGSTWTIVAPRYHQNKHVFVWRLCKSKEAYLLLKKILPYLVIKKSKAEDVIAKLETFRFYGKRGKFGGSPITPTGSRTIPSQALQGEGVEVRGEIIPICAARESEDMTRTTE